MSKLDTELLTKELQELIAKIKPSDRASQDLARARHSQLTKPSGSLGQLEELGIWLAGIQHTEKPNAQEKIVIVCAADHGVTQEGISAYPASVTPAMIHNILRGGAAINAIAKTVGAKIVLIDAGVNADLPNHPHLQALHIRRGTNNIAETTAITQNEALQAILGGAHIAHTQIAKGINIVATGELGIGNTTPASAITAYFTGAKVQTITGRGTGINDTAYNNKVQAIEKALARTTPLNNPIEILCELGGLEIAALVGVMLACAANQVAIILDGLITGAAALLACELAASTKDYLLAADMTAEPGHAVQLKHLGLKPLFHFGLRLGEGTGSALVLPILEAAARVLSEMATFEEANVPGKD